MEETKRETRKLIYYRDWDYMFKRTGFDIQFLEQFNIEHRHAIYYSGEFIIVEFICKT